MKQIVLAILLIAAASCQTKPGAENKDWHTLYIVKGKDTTYCNGTTRGIGNILSVFPGTYYGYHYDSTLKVNIVYYTPGKDIIIKDNTFIMDSSAIREADSFGISIEAPNNSGTVIGNQTINNP